MLSQIGTFAPAHPLQNPTAQCKPMAVQGSTAIGPFVMDQFLEVIPENFKQHVDTLRKATFPVYRANYRFAENAIAISTNHLLFMGQCEIGETVFVAGKEATVYFKASQDYIHFAILFLKDRAPLPSIIPLANSKPDLNGDNYLHVMCQRENDINTITQAGLYDQFDAKTPSGAAAMCPYSGKAFGIHAPNRKPFTLQTRDIYSCLESVIKKGEEEDAKAHEIFEMQKASEILELLRLPNRPRLKERLYREPLAASQATAQAVYQMAEQRAALVQLHSQQNEAFLRLANQQLAAMPRMISQHSLIPFPMHRPLYHLMPLYQHPYIPMPPYQNHSHLMPQYPYVPMPQQMAYVP